jgi:hypothetical protein
LARVFGFEAEGALQTWCKGRSARRHQDVKVTDCRQWQRTHMVRDRLRPALGVVIGARDVHRRSQDSFFLSAGTSSRELHWQITEAGKEIRINWFWSGRKTNILNLIDKGSEQG